MSSTAAAVPSPSPPPLSPERRSIDQPHLHLLHCFALADLLDLPPATQQRMALAAASVAAEAPPTSSPSCPCSSGNVSSSSALSNAVEDVMLAAVVERVTTSPDTPQTAKNSPQNVKTVPSALEAPPWAPSTQDTHTEEPGPSTSHLSLPPVLLYRQGVVRLDALHPCFLLQLLGALLHAACSSERDAATTKERTRSQDAFLHLLRLCAPLLVARQREVLAVVNELVVKLSHVNIADELVESGDGCCAQVNSCLHEHFSSNGMTQQWGSAFRTFLNTAVTLLTAQSRKTVAVVGNTTTHASARSSKDAEGTAAPVSSSTSPAKATKGNGAVSSQTGGLPNAPYHAPSAQEQEARDAVWLLQSLGVMLSIVGLSSNIKDSADLERKSEFTSEALSTPPAAAAAGNGSIKATGMPEAKRAVEPLPSFNIYRCAMSAEALALAAVIADVAAQLPQGETLPTLSNSPPASPSSNTPARMMHIAALSHCIADLAARKMTESFRAAPSESHHKASTNTLGAPLSLLSDNSFQLYTRLYEEQQKQQHRLLAAAERAVQRVLLLPAMPWTASELVVALCHVTAYQLTTQHQQRRQQLLALTTEWNDDEEKVARCVGASPSVTALPALVMDTSAKGETASPLLKEEGVRSATAQVKPVPLGEVVWSESDLDGEGEAENAHDEATTESTTAALQSSRAAETTLTSTVGRSLEAFGHEEGARSGKDLHQMAEASSSALQHRSQQQQQQQQKQCSHPSPPTTSLRFYTPRASSLSRAAQPPALDGTPNHSDTHASSTAHHPLHDPVRYFSATRSMEHLWELPARVPRRWTPALSTVMACCALCLPPSSTATARLCFLTGEPIPVALTHTDADTPAATSAAPPPLPSLSSTPQSSARASPRASLLDFGFVRRRESVLTPAKVESSSSQSPRVLDPTTGATATSVSSSTDAAVVGALAQWHLRGLLCELRAPSDGIELCAANSGRDAGTGATSSAATAASVSGKVNVGPNSMLPAGLSSHAGVPSSAGAAGGASWFAAYTQATKRANPPQEVFSSTAPATTTTFAAPPRTSRAAVSSTGEAVAVLRPINTVSILACCFALQHLLRAHNTFFLHAQLGGTALRELRSGVAAARRFAGGTAGWVAGMLQCTPCLAHTFTGGVSTTPSNNLGSKNSSSGISNVGGGGGANIWEGQHRVSAPHLRNSRSLWGEAGLAGQGVDRSATAMLDGAALRYGEDVSDASHGAPLAPASSDFTANTPTPSGAQSRAMRSEAEAGGVDDNDDDDGGVFAPASTCALTEAILVAASFLGSRVVAAALPTLQALPSLPEAQTAADAAASLAVEGEECRLTFLSRAQQEWCDALQALTGVVLDAHRVHRAQSNATVLGHSQQQHVQVNGAQSGFSSVTQLPGLREHSSASPKPEQWRAGSAGSAREASVGSYGTSNRIDNAFPTTASQPPAVLPPSLSIEAQFGIGTFFLSIARALVQVRAVRADAPPKVQQKSLPQWTVVERSLVHCLFALASVMDDLLHDYRHRPPTALCDVLAMFSIIQIPCTGTTTEDEAERTVVGEGREKNERPSPRPSSPPPAVAPAVASQPLWEALHHTPYWDPLRFDALEAASQAWSAPPDAPTASPMVAIPKATPTTTTTAASTASAGMHHRRLSASLESAPSVACPRVPPRESLLGYIPCSRDATCESWLPARLRAQGSQPYSHHVVSSRTLLELMAEEEECVLATRETNAGASTNADTPSPPPPPASPGDDTARNKEKDEEKQQLMIAVAASRRYAWWVSRLLHIWDDALREKLSAT